MRPAQDPASPSCRRTNSGQKTPCINTIIMVAIGIFLTCQQVIAAEIPVETGLVLWLRADNVTTAGATVTGWTDLTGSLSLGDSVANNASPRVGAPTFVASAVNGLPAVEFGGSDDYQFLGALGFSGQAAFTSFVVGTNTGGPAEQRIFQIGDVTNPSPGGSAVAMDIGTPALRYNNGNRVFNEDVWNGATYSISEFSMSPTSTYGSGELFQNGTAATQASSTSAGSTTNLTDGGYRLGGGISGSTNYFFTGRLAEVILFNSDLSAADSDRIGFYLDQRYGITTTYTAPTIAYFDNASAANSNWETPANWDTAVSPITAQTAVINGGKVLNYIGSDGTNEVANLIIGSNATGGAGAGNGTLNISGGRIDLTKTPEGTTTLGVGGTTGTLNITGGTFSSPNVVINNGSMVTWSGGGMVNFQNGHDPDFVLNTGSTLQYTGAAAYDVDSDRYAINGNATIDASGTGKLTISRTNIGVTNNPVITLTGTGDGEISTSIASGAGAAAIVKEGTGTWTLSSDNNRYNGNTTANNGTLIISGFEALHANSELIINNGGTIVSATARVYAGAVPGKMTINDGGTFTVDAAGATNRYQANTLDMTGGTISSGYNNDPYWGYFADQINVHPNATNSTIAIGRLSAPIAGGTLDINVDATAQLDITGTIRNPQSGTTQLIKAGDGVLKLTQSGNNYTGGTTVNAGNLILTGSNNGNSVVGTGAITVNTNGTVTASNNNVFGYNNGQVPDLILNGGTFVPYDFTNLEQLTMTGGTITAGSSAAGRGLIFQHAAGRNLDTNASATTSTIDAKISISGGNLIVTTANGAAAVDLALNGTITEDGGITKLGAGKMLLAGTNDYSGGTIIGNGTETAGNIVAVGSNTALGTGAVTILGAGIEGNGAARTLANSLVIGASTGTSAFFSGQNLTFNGTVNLAGGLRDIDVTNTTTLGGVISNGGLSKSGTGTLTVTQNNTYTGGTVLNDGVLRTNNTSGLGTTGSTIILNGGTLQLAGGGADADHIYDLNVVGTAMIQAITNRKDLVGDITGSGTLELIGTMGLRLEGDMSGFSGTLIKSSNNELHLMIDNSAFGIAATTSGSADATFDIRNGGKIFLLNNNQAGTAYMGALAGTAGEIYGKFNRSGDVTLEVGALGTNTEFGGLIANNGNNPSNSSTALHKVGSGSLQLNGNNTYTGDTVVSNGTLLVGDGAGAGQLNGASNLTVEAAGTFVFNAPSTPTFANEISGSGTIVKQTGDTVTLTGANDASGSDPAFTGHYRVDTGTLAVASVAALGSPTQITIAAGSTFDASAFPVFAPTAPVIVQGTGTLLTGGSLAVNSNVTLSPGNSPGQLDIVANVDWSGAVGPGGTYNWQVLDSVPGPGNLNGYDLINITGSLDMTGGSGTINAIGLSSISPDVAGLPLNVDMEPGAQTLFEIIRTSAGVIGFGSFSPTFVNSMNHKGFFKLLLGNGGNSVYLLWEATPEPGTWVLFGLLGCASAFGLRRRRPHTA